MELLRVFAVVVLQESSVKLLELSLTELFDEFPKEHLEDFLVQVLDKLLVILRINL